MYKNTILHCCIVKFQYINKTLSGEKPLVLSFNSLYIKHCCKEQAEDLKINVYSCLGIDGNIFSVRAHSIYKWSTKTIFAKTTSQLSTTPHFQHFKTYSFFISIFVLKNNYIVVLSQKSVDWMFDFSFSEKGTSTCSPIYSNSKDPPNFCENSQVFAHGT